MVGIAGGVRRHPVAAFFVLTYALTWAVWVPMAVSGATVHQGSAWPTHVLGLCGLVAAVVSTGVMVCAVLIVGFELWRGRRQRAIAVRKAA